MSLYKFFRRGSAFLSLALIFQTLPALSISQYDEKGNLRPPAYSINQPSENFFTWLSKLFQKSDSSPASAISSGSGMMSGQEGQGGGGWFTRNVMEPLRNMGNNELNGNNQPLVNNYNPPSYSNVPAPAYESPPPSYSRVVTGGSAAAASGPHQQGALFSTSAAAVKTVSFSTILLNVLMFFAI